MVLLKVISYAIYVLVIINIYYTDFVQQDFIYNGCWKSGPTITHKNPH